MKPTQVLANNARSMIKEVRDTITAAQAALEEIDLACELLARQEEAQTPVIEGFVVSLRELATGFQMMSDYVSRAVQQIEATNQVSAGPSFRVFVLGESSVASSRVSAPCIFEAAAMVVRSTGPTIKKCGRLTVRLYDEKIEANGDNWAYEAQLRSK